jgi:hypothetical protein
MVRILLARCVLELDCALRAAGVALDIHRLLPCGIAAELWDDQPVIVVVDRQYGDSWKIHGSYPPRARY